jgi:peptide/nickel transport system permease protein
MMEAKTKIDEKAGQETLSLLFWKRFRKNKLALLGAVIVLFLFVVAVSAPWIAPYDPGQIQIKRVLEEPSVNIPLEPIPWGGMFSVA